MDTSKDAAARAILMDPEATGEGALCAALALLEDFYVWEPETIWIELERLGVHDIPRVNCDKLMAATTLWCMPSFYWDAIVFEKTALAFSGQEPNPEILQEATPAEIAWALEEATHIRRRHGDPAMDPQSEVIGYTAVVLHRQAMTCAPDTLSFAQKRLDALNHRDSKDLCSRVNDAWKDIHAKGTPLRDFCYEENDVCIQLAHLAAVEVFVEDRRKQRVDELKRLAMS